MTETSVTGPLYNNIKPHDVQAIVKLAYGKI